jgi:hypothetical protein
LLDLLAHVSAPAWLILLRCSVLKNPGAVSLNRAITDRIARNESCLVARWVERPAGCPMLRAYKAFRHTHPSDRYIGSRDKRRPPLRQRTLFPSWTKPVPRIRNGAPGRRKVSRPRPVRVWSHDLDLLFSTETTAVSLVRTDNTPQANWHQLVAHGGIAEDLSHAGST